jgi:hypothetical protein
MSAISRRATSYLRPEPTSAVRATPLQRRYVSQSLSTAAVFRDRVGGRAATEMQVKRVEAVDHRQVVSDGRRRVPGPQVRFSGAEVHRSNLNTAGGLSFSLGVWGATQPADQGCRLGFRCLFPADVDRPQHPEPAQQIVGVAAARQSAAITEDLITQVGADGFDLSARSVNDPIRQHLARSGQHFPDSRKPRTSLHQLHMHNGGSMKLSHTAIIGDPPLPVDPIGDLVQSTVQWGGRTPKALGRELDGQLWDEMPEAATG